MPITFACEYRFPVAMFPSYNKYITMISRDYIASLILAFRASLWKKKMQLIEMQHFFTTQRKALRFKTGRVSRITQPSATAGIRAAPAKRDVISEIPSERVCSRRKIPLVLVVIFNISLLTLDTDVPFLLLCNTYNVL